MGARYAGSLVFAISIVSILKCIYCLTVISRYIQWQIFHHLIIKKHKYGNNINRVRNLKFATCLKFAPCENTNKINEFW